MAKFEVVNEDLFINGQKVIKAWESFSGWYWFAVELVRIQDSDFGDRVIKGDRIWHGLVQGVEEEWGDFSEAELKMLYPKVWPIPKKALPYSGRRA